MTIGIGLRPLSVRDYSRFSDTLPRLIGLHNLSGTRAAHLLDMSSQHMWMLINGRRRPTYERLRAIEELFGIDHDRLVDVPFEELLQTELADPLPRRRDAHRSTARTPPTAAKGRRVMPTPRAREACSQR